MIPCRYVRHMSLVVVISFSLARPSMPDVVVTYTKSEDLYSRNYEMVNSYQDTTDLLIKLVQKNPFSYSPLTGFSVLSAVPEEHTGQYTCTFSKPNTTHKEMRIIQVHVTREYNLSSLFRNLPSASTTYNCTH